MSRAQASGVAALFNDYRQFAGSRLWLALALLASGAIAEGFGLLMIVPLASIAIGEQDARLAPFADWMVGFSEDQRFIVALALFLAAMAARSALLCSRDCQVARLEAEYEASLRLRTAATLARKGWPFASRIGQAGMQSLLMVDVPRSALAISFFQQFAISAVMVAVPLALTALLSPALTGVAVLLLAGGAFASRRWIRRGSAAGLAFRETTERSVTTGFHFHAGLKAALAQGTVRPFLDEYRASLANVSRQSVQLMRDYTAAHQLAALGAAVAAALLLFVGVRVLALPFSVLIASLVLFARISSPAQVLLRSAQQAAAYAPSFAAIEARLGSLEPVEPGTQQPEPLDWAELRLDAVRFDHGGGLGLQSASGALARGEWLGIEGPSGAGKTTLVDLLAGLLEPQAGLITVDGQPLEGMRLAQWQAGLAYVGQEAIVFDDSVRGNLLAGGAAADDESMWRALETVGMADRLRLLPEGLDASVGDRGNRLSGGEQQRLVIARALLRRPALLILDEATAALDSESEAALLVRLRASEPRPSAIVIAHRQSTLAHCDSVVRIQHGRLQGMTSPCD